MCVGGGGVRAQQGAAASPSPAWDGRMYDTCVHSAGERGIEKEERQSVRTQYSAEKRRRTRDNDGRHKDEERAKRAKQYPW